MKLSPSLIAILRCPENHQSLALADDNILSKLNQNIDQKQISNHSGRPIQEKIEAGLIREDQQRLYPIKDGFPVMLIDESIDLT